MSRDPAKPDLQVVESRIFGATVFSESAHVTRRAALGVERGLRRVAFAGLPAQVDAGSLRVTTSRGVVRAIETETLERSVAEDSDTAALARAAHALRAKLQRIGGELEGLHAELALIDRVAPAGGPNGITPALLRPEVFLAGLDVLEGRRRDTIARIRGLEDEQIRDSEALAELDVRRSLVGETGGSQREQSVLVVSLEVEESGDCALDLTYEAAWATWRPYYHVRLDGKENTVECARFADVWQETGEDWLEARLRLSTAEPEAGLRIPTVLPWSLGVAKSYEDKLSDLYSERRKRKPAPPQERRPYAPPPAPGPMSRGAPMQMAPPPSMAFGADAPEHVITGVYALDDEGGSTDDLDELDAYKQQFEEEGIFREVTAAGLMAMRAEQAPVDGAPIHAPASTISMEAPPPPPPPEPPDRRRRGLPPDHPDRGRLTGTGLPRDSSGGINFEMEVGAPANVSSGKERQRLGLGSLTYPAKIEYLLRPAVRDHAFGRVTVINNEPVPLLAGPVAIFVGEAFFGESEMKTTPAGGKLVLDLGAETAIKCARRTKTTVRTEGILTKEDVHVVEVAIDIENHMGRIVELEVQDQVPVSKDSKVKIHLIRSTPKDAVLDELTGIVTFKVRAPAGMKTELALVYEIEAPKDYQFRQMLKD